MRITITKICSIVFAIVVSSAALSNPAERQFIQTLHPEIEELPPPQTFFGFGTGVLVQGDLALVGTAIETDHAAVFTREDQLWRRTGELPCSASTTCIPVALQDDVALVIGTDPISAAQAILIFRNEQGAWTLTDSIAKPLPDIPDMWIRTVRYRDGMVVATVGPTTLGPISRSTTAPSPWVTSCGHLT